uniref:G-protein coupled receptors family 1 profile domain-containing protein n=1 Tax=Mola mola TaxID=94237 RepID=A0A3Q3WPQ8_MOLML
HPNTIPMYSSWYDYNGSDNDYAPSSSSNVRTFGQVFLTTFFSLVFIIGVLGNGLVLCVLLKHWRQNNLTDICLFNLALSDLLFVLTLPFFTHYAAVGEWCFGDFMCRFAAMCNTIGFFSSIFFMVLMTVDRYVVIVHALTVARYRTLRAGVALTVVVWILSFSVSLPILIFTKVANESYGLGCRYAPESYDWKLYELCATNILGLVLPLLVMVACYSRIIPKLVNMRSAKRHRVIKLIISIVLTFFLFWTPYNLSMFLDFLKSEGKLQGDKCCLQYNLQLAVIVTEALAFSHCCLNPIIYAFVGQRFMKRALGLLRNWVPWLHLVFFRDLSDSSHRKSSVVSRSSDVSSTIIT